MRISKTYAMAVLLTGLFWTAASNCAQAGNSAASQHATMREACTKQGGRFELSWMYNDQGVRWGKVLSCSTSNGFIRCQGGLCRVGRRVSRDTDVAAKERDAKELRAMQFAAKPATFFEALAALSDN